MISQVKIAPKSFYGLPKCLSLRFEPGGLGLDSAGW